MHSAYFYWAAILYICRYLYSGVILAEFSTRIQKSPRFSYSAKAKNMTNCQCGIHFEIYFFSTAERRNSFDDYFHRGECVLRYWNGIGPFLLNLIYLFDFNIYWAHQTLLLCSLVLLIVCIYSECVFQTIQSTSINTVLYYKYSMIEGMCVVKVVALLHTFTRSKSTQCWKFNLIKILYLGKVLSTTPWK